MLRCCAAKTQLTKLCSLTVRLPLQIVFAARGKNLFFSAEPEKWIAESDCVFVSVNTPTKTKGVGSGKAADLSFWEGAARMIASVSKTSKIVVEKSTVPVKTAEAIGKVRSGSLASAPNLNCAPDSSQACRSG